MCSGSEVGSYLRLIDFVNHSALGMRVIRTTEKYERVRERESERERERELCVRERFREKELRSRSSHLG